jgi:hypothetical protein
VSTARADARGRCGADAAAPWKDDLAFGSVVAASGDASGTSHLRHVVRQLAVGLDVAYAFVAEFAESPLRVRTVTTDVVAVAGGWGAIPRDVGRVVG